MSKRVKIDIVCPHCAKHYTDDFFRTYWGEDEGMRKNIMDDNVNIASCPYCGHSFHLPLAMMYVDVHVKFAVWWEPNYDAGIDSDANAYAQMFGEKSFYATAPRIADWEEFKRTINKYYRGELVGGTIEKMEFSTIKKAANGARKSGCLGIALLLISCMTLFLALFN